MKHRSKSRRLSNKLTYTGKHTTPTTIHHIQYNESFFQEKDTNNIQEILLAMAKVDTVNWIQVMGMSDPNLIIQLVKDFGLNLLDAKDILTIQHLITVDEYDDNLFIVLPAVYFNDENKEITEHIALVLGKNYVLSFQESNYLLFEGVFQAIKDNSLKINNKKADFLLATLLNVIMTNYSDYVGQLEESLEDLEDLLLDVEHLKSDLIGEIQENRRKMIRIRKLLMPFKDQFAKLLRADKALIGKLEVPFFKDIYDQLLYILQNIESCREIMSSLVDLYLNNNDLKMNLIMKRLTVVATIFIPLTFLVGVWGMNFKYMPELDWRYGYLYAWGLMLAIGIYVIWYLKKKDWF